MADLIEFLFKDFLRLLGLLARILVWLIYELFFETIAWYVGWPICQLLSLGRWPKQGINDQENASQISQGLVSVIGLISLFVLAASIAFYAGEIRLN
ncbi:hypothetical protein [Pseudoteredinibacter isoporae]|uniref:Uncharacterized protein n=1 Tax=Pseudoteredinibacter isoporae TaxID=570281 RepID=A0A7X0JPB5_9GAMM|nr:hypothetical protein [Pseudoteredinibacter isoporae]MBB6519823.1 hypothetical protein [Pseudoteredinibacter isoporae]NHO85403.1 hypothetical protein [Pseudoteredinibacter isoporae]NIB26145.1 hypothetical protein [Pseudoteredinibacter isoporae]